MYQYDSHDQQLIDQRVAQFRDQVQRYQQGELGDDEFRPLRLMNGLYMQIHAYMLRVAIPYGLLSSVQLRTLAHIARRYDKGYGHFTTRQNIQYNWPKLEDVPDILAELASVQMHAIQTSGNCIRNTTSDQFAGVAQDESTDPRPYCELIRQWSTFHPEFTYLPRKFKIAVSGSAQDRAAVQFHDIGLYLRRNDAGELGFEVLVGGGLGRTPYVGETIRDFLPEKDLLSYLEAILRVYNLLGRRDNKYKARIKILLHALGREKMQELVEQEWQAMDRQALELTQAEISRVSQNFLPPAYQQDRLDNPPELVQALADNPAFATWYRYNTTAHKQRGYRAVTLSLKPHGKAPGDMTAEQMDAVASLADVFSFGELRVSHHQNLVLADIEQQRLPELWQQLVELNLATPNIGTLTDIICCPGLSYCSLANAHSIPVAERIQQHFDDLDYVHDLGDLRINISGCMNACGHHHAAHIGILGVDKKGREFYQVTLGGSSQNEAAIGKIIGPAFSSDEIIHAIDKLIQVYLAQRHDDEPFLATYRRIGEHAFKERLYG